jgi:hypothetical protein
MVKRANGGDQQMEAAEWCLPTNPVIIGKGARRRTAKLIIT